MKVNNISLINKINYTGIKKNKTPVFHLEKGSVVKELPNNGKIVLGGIKYKTTGNFTADYMKVLDKNNRRLREIRYNKRYNIFDAIKFKKENNIDTVQDRLTIFFNNDGDFCGFYLINENNGRNIHTHVYPEYQNKGIEVFGVKNGRFCDLSEQEKQDSIRFSFQYINKVLKEARENHLLPR